VKSPYIIAVFLIFVITDIADGRIKGPEYRPYDTLGDRIFTYANFITFLIIFQPIYYPLIYILAFAIRDLVVLSVIVKYKKYLVISNILDKFTILLTAVLFVSHVIGIIPLQGVFTGVLCSLVALLNLFQGYSKIKRIKVNQELSQ